jgi:hypothetical protein
MVLLIQQLLAAPAIAFSSLLQVMLIKEIFLKT